MKRQHAVRFALFLIVCVGIAVRFTGLTRDGLYGFHPDEILMAGGVMTIRLPEQPDPGFFDYNGFPLYLVRAVAVLRARLGAGEAAVRLPGVLTAGRSVSAAFSAASVPLIYLLGVQLVGPVWAIPATLLFAVGPLSVQLAHFFTTESILVFFFLSTLVALVYWRRHHSRGLLVAAAVSAGLGIGSKTTFVLALPIPLILILVGTGPWKRRMRLLVLFSLIALVIFAVVSPLVLAEFPRFLERTRYLSDMVTGRQIYDWTAQFQHQSPFFILRNLYYAAGPFQTAAGIGGLVLLTYEGIRKRRVLPAILGGWGIAFLVYLTLQYARFIRYTLMLIPLLAVGSVFLVYRLRQMRQWLLASLLVAIAVADIGWGIAFTSLYRSEHPFLPLSRYMAAAVPGNSRILYEMWNCLCYPVGVSDLPLSWYNFNFYNPDTTEKTAALADALAKHDFFIMTTDKVYRTVTRLSDMYPVSTRFYRMLFAGDLGYRLEREYRQFPSLGPIVIDDSGSEETFRVFDHPHVYVFRNTGRFSAERYLRLLTSP